MVVKPFFGERLDMDTDDLSDDRAFLAALDSPDWSGVLDAMSAADTWIRTAIVGDPMLDEVVAKLITLAHHPKWEIRRAVANAAGQAAHPAFETMLAKLLLDDNGRVRQAAQQAALRRRDSRNASSLGKQHAERINATLDDIEARFGLRGREAVKRAAEQIANTFARELYPRSSDCCHHLRCRRNGFAANFLPTTSPAGICMKRLFALGNASHICKPC